MNKISKLFQPLLITPKNATVKHQDLTSKSQRLMLEMGLIRSSSNGMFHILPLLQKSLEKCIRLVDECMSEIGAQKVTMPALTPSELWKKTKRFDTAATELLLVKDRHEKEHILSPTHEEAVTAMLSSMSPVSYRSLPLKLYQITPKFRDELKPRFGLLRTKEFLMKDLYTFDSSLKAACSTYEEVNQAYDRLFKKIGVEFLKITADSGMMGGSMSHEYHYESSIGEDTLVNCTNCKFKGNQEIFVNQVCPKCNSEELVTKTGIEIAHTFVLEDKYTKPLKATFLEANGKPSPMVMGCYGIGITRLIAGALEVLSLEDQIRWPYRLAPYSVCIIPPKSGSKEEVKIRGLEQTIYEALLDTFDKNEIITDDRTSTTIGKRFLEAKRTGYPFIVVIGEKAANEMKFECHDQTNETSMFLELPELLEYLKKSTKTTLDS